MTVSGRISKYLDLHPEIISNIKQFRALVLDVTENDIALTNLIVLANSDGLHIKISALKKSQRKEINNLIHSFTVRHCIDQKFEDRLYEFYANVFAERIIPETSEIIKKDEEPITNLKIRPSSLKFPPKPLKWYCPCGSNKKDSGFYIRNIIEAEKCLNRYASVYSVVLGMLQRSINPEKSLFIKEYEEKIRREIPYSDALRSEILILLLIKNNYDKDNVLTFSASADKDIINAAVYEINRLASLISSLAYIDYFPLKAEFKEDGIQISETEIHTENAPSRESLTRIQWSEKQLIYKVDNSNESGLSTLLEILFGFDSFLPGQKECLINILNSGMKSSVTILPVGGGKSLIYYFVAYLRTCPIFIVSPSVLLISDQFRSLKLFHDIDDAAQLTYEMDFSEFEPANKLIYLTPKTFLNRDLLCRLIRLNFSHNIGGIVLDEVHCISNWGHDFRPEYLMLSYNLNEFLSDQGKICFTGTANYRVINDISEQLNIATESVYCPVTLKNTKFSFRFTAENNKENMLNAISKEIENVSDDNSDRRTIVFTRSPKDGLAVYSGLSDNAKTNVDIAGKRYISFHDFIKGETNTIICGEKFGVGINLPRINNIIHAGAPLSKGQYIQEIGRAARNGGKSQSLVSYIRRDDFEEADLPIVDRSVSSEKLTELYNDGYFSEEGKLIVSKLFGNIEKRESLERNVFRVMQTIDSLNKDGRISYKVDENLDFKDEISRITRYFYILFRTGYIYGWYFDRIDEVNRLITFYVDPGKERDIENASAFVIDYISKMGNHRKTVTEIKHARNFTELIKSYTKWYYSQLLYYHREQYLDMLEFLENYPEDSELISLEINKYFSLSVLNIQKNSETAKVLPVSEIFSAASQIGNNDISESVRAALENEYSPKLDLFIFVYNSSKGIITDTNRLRRVMNNFTAEERKDVLNSIVSLYANKDTETKLSIISMLTEFFTIKELLSILYSTNEKDVVYYYIEAKIGNNIFRG